MNTVNYKSLLEKRNFVNWLKSISLNDPDPSVKQVADELVSLVDGDYPIPASPFYEGLYLKYKFKLFSTKTDEGQKNVLYSYDGQNLKAIGVLQKQTSKRVIPVSPTPSPTISLTPSPTISLTPTVTPTVTPTISLTPTVTVTPSISLTPTVTPSVTTP